MNWLLYYGNICRKLINPFQLSVAFRMETSHLICSANQMTGFYMECNTGVKWVNKVSVLFPLKVFQKYFVRHVCFVLIEIVFAWDTISWPLVKYFLVWVTIYYYSRQFEMFSHSTFIIVYSLRIRVFLNWIAFNELVIHLALTSSKSTMETPEQVVKSVQS